MITNRNRVNRMQKCILRVGHESGNFHVCFVSTLSKQPCISLRVRENSTRLALGMGITAQNAFRRCSLMGWTSRTAVSPGTNNVVHAFCCFARFETCRSTGSELTKPHERLLSAFSPNIVPFRSRPVCILALSLNCKVWRLLLAMNALISPCDSFALTGRSVCEAFPSPNVICGFSSHCAGRRMNSFVKVQVAFTASFMFMFRIHRSTACADALWHMY